MRRGGATLFPMGHRSRFLALAGVCIVMMSGVLAGCDSVTSIKPESNAFSGCGSAASAGPVSPGVTPVSPGFTGYDWQVVAISHDGQVTCIPAWMHPYEGRAPHVTLHFTPGGRFGADDSINFHSGTYRTTSDGFTTSHLSSTAVFDYRQDPATVLAIGAIYSFDKRLPATVTLTGDRLVIGVGSYTMYCRRCGPRPDPPRLGHIATLLLDLRAGAPITCG